MKRNYGIDLLRITAMLFVIILHITGVGGICIGSELLSAHFLTAQFLRIATTCSVNCYALISGYVGWNRSPKLSSLLNLWAKVVCFCVSITVIARLPAPELVGWADLKKALTPATSGVYWYFSAYAVLFFFTPILNHGIRHISRREAILALGGIAAAVFCIPVTSLGSVFALGGGYSAVWLMILYLAGGLMGRFEVTTRLSKGQWAGLYLLAVLANYVPRMVLLVLRPELWTPDNQNLMVQYLSPTIILAAVALLGLFSQLQLSEAGIRIVAKLSPYSFGVYLLHTHPLIFQRAIVGQFTALGTVSMPKLLGILLLAAAVIYAAGTAADWALTKLLKLLRIDRLLKKPDQLFR